MRAALAPAAALLCAACSYDLDVLRGRDAGADARRPDASGDVAAPDVAPDAPADRPAPDVAPPDVAPPRDASMGTCMGHDAVLLSGATPGVVSADGVLTVTGTTVGGEAAIAGCHEAASTTMSTRVYRYVVQSGPRLVATTNTGLCGAGMAAAHDTILGAYLNCNANGLVPGPRSCVDDDDTNVCLGMSACATNTELGCNIAFSTLELSGLARGDVVYLAVSSYPMAGLQSRGPFRLSVAENGLPPAAPPTTGTPVAANRCMCPSSTMPPAMWATRAVEFPRGAVQNQLGADSRSIFATRPVGLTQVWGLSGVLRLSQFNVSTAGPCGVSGGALAALDVIVGTVVVASVTLGVYVGEPGTVTIPFTTFTPITFAAGAEPLFQYRIRNVQPATATCVTLNVDTAAPNTLTLYGAM
ncbi:MAG: hypothetical protein U0324_39205 [Polyangiales bacterium]